jgi:hyperpolarization activated cyclic nucleotide-gated potassium channel 2
MGTDEDGTEDPLYNSPKLLRAVKIFRFLRILKLIRLAKLKQIVMKLEDFFTSITFSTIFVALKLLMMVGFIAHWTACWFHYISYENSYAFPDVWIRRFG